MAGADGGNVEQQQLQEKAWVFAQRSTLLLVAVLIGVFVGHQLWGQARALREQVTQLQERVTRLQKERDTLNSQKVILERDKREAEKRLQDLQARCAAPAEAVPSARP